MDGEREVFSLIAVKDQDDIWSVSVAVSDVGGVFVLRGKDLATLMAGIPQTIADMRLARIAIADD